MPVKLRKHLANRYPARAESALLSDHLANSRAFDCSQDTALSNCWGRQLSIQRGQAYRCPRTEVESASRTPPSYIAQPSTSIPFDSFKKEGPGT